MRTRSSLLLFVLALLAPAASAQVVSAPVPSESGLVGVSGFPATGIPGQAPFDDFGWSVSDAGDVNGDGFGDFIVGAQANDAVGNGAGRAYVYFGGPGADALADLTLTGEAAGDGFGNSVSGAGDVNGDGFADVIVGASGNDAGGSSAGRAYVYFGGPSADAVADLTLTGEAASDIFGRSVSGAGDINGDGFADIIVGAPLNDAGGSNAGRAYVYLGGPTADAVADLTLTGQAINDFLGRAVSGASDVNGDGYDDLLVGADGSDAGGTDAGQAFVFFGGASPDATPDLALTGEAAGDGFGDVVSDAGDINGDGFADLIVGANRNDAAGLNAGRAYVYFGGASPDTVADLTLTGEAEADTFGRSVSGAGDVNGDGFADVIVGASGNDAGGDGAGRATVYFGGPGADAVPDLTMTGTEPTQFLGFSVSGAGDLDGDGLADLVVGALDVNTANGTRTGAVYVYSNANTGTAVAEWLAEGDASGDTFGNSVSSAGDVNGDGYDDIIVGAPFNDADGLSAGRAYVYFGGPGADRVADLTLTAETAGDNFGIAVSGAGDINGDGFADLIVGAYRNDVGGTNAGRAYVYFGGSAPDAVPDLVLTGENASDNFGRAVAGAGDVNGDGFADLIVGAPGDQTPTGAAYLFLGGLTPDSTPDQTFSGAASGDQFGFSVSGAGDMNGDGFADLVVGAHRNDAGGADAGRAYIYFGGPGLGPFADLTITGASADEELGRSVSGGGDINGDGYADVLVGVPQNEDAGSFYGAVLVFFGSASPDPVADLFIPGQRTNGIFGSAAANVGDINSDGYADLAVGTEFDPRVFVYYGGASPDGEPDLRFETHTGSRSISGGGDVDGDGRSDLIVGAPADNSTGTAYLFRATGPAASPGLYRLADVPGDQGGVLQARWTRSDQETQGTVSSYLVQRSEPAGTTGYAWGTIATVPGSMEPRYSLAVPTYSDQTGSNPGTTCVRVTAQGDNGELWRSMVSCAASIDNLAPAAPPLLALTASPDGDVALMWGEVTGEPDLFGYDIFKSDDASCDASDPLAGSASATEFEDDATAFGTDAWYCVASRDVHGNLSPVTDAANANPAVLAAVKVVLEGAYQSGLSSGALMRTNLEEVLPEFHPFGGAPWRYRGPEALDQTDSDGNGRPDVLDAYDVVDWVLIGLRSNETEADEARAAALLLSDGTLLNPSTGQPYASVKPAAPGAYHVVVYHRSHLAAMSAFAVALDGDAPGSAYDLSVSRVFVYNEGVKDLGNVFALFAGDGDADGSVLAPDEQSVWGPSVGLAGYLSGDFNLDGSVLADDQQVLWVPNVGAQSEVPGAASLTRPVEARAGTSRPSVQSTER